MINDSEFLRQQILHSGETKQQILKKDEHIKLLEDRIRVLDDEVLVLRKSIACKSLLLNLI